MSSLLANLPFELFLGRVFKAMIPFTWFWLLLEGVLLDF